MIRSRATRSIRRILPSAGLVLLVAVLVGGLAASAPAGVSVTVGSGGSRIHRGGGIHRGHVGRSRRHNDALGRLHQLRRHRRNHGSLLRTRPHNNVLRTRPHSSLRRRSDDIRSTHRRFRLGDPADRHRHGDHDGRHRAGKHRKGHPHGNALLRRRIRRHYVRKYLPTRRYIYPYRHPHGSSVIVRTPGTIYRSYRGTVYTVPGTGLYSGEPAYGEAEVRPEPDLHLEPEVRARPDPRLNPGIEVPQEALDAAADDHGVAATEAVWGLLGRGRSAEALTAFSRIGQTIRAAGVPKIGAALALGMLRQYDRAAWAMRRAVRLDPEAVAHVPVDDALAERLDRLVQAYRRNEHHGVLAKDATFMLAVLHGLRTEWDAAHEMIDLAREVGDTSQAAAAYRQYLDRAHPRR